MWSKNKIVLVEDDEMLGATILELLQLKSFDVEWFKNGLDALHYFKTKTCDLIISDLMMPKMNGEEFFLQMRNELNSNAIPFIIITANIDQHTKYTQLENGVNDYLLKPFKIDELIHKVNNLLSFKLNIVKQYRTNPFSKVTIKLSEKNFITAVNEILIRNLKNTIVQKELAELLFISKSTLDKRIRKLTNKNASKYVREFKLDYAIHLITLGEKNVQFLADETGFNSFSYFSTCFKDYSGISPSAFIKNQKL
ncbi:response regulator transcription factor [Flavobacterium sp. SM2513]|uniref:response regulator transcription factor n=1 Tax=Flavobacterium sp. SM2513 TaxID=3424766 RepID=UPI003D7F6B61